MRLLRPLIWTVATLVIVAAGAWFYALHTTSGARMIWSQVEGATGGSLSANQVSGDVANGLSINGVSFRDDGLVVTVRELTATIDVDLFPLAIDVEVARAMSVVVEVRETSGTGSEESNIKDTLNGLVLPVPVRVSNFQADDISFDNAGDVIQILSLELVALWHEDISIQKLRVRNSDVDASVDAQIGLRNTPAFFVNAHVLVDPNLTGTSEPVRLTTKGSGDLLGMDVVAEIGGFASVEGEVSWEKELIASADVLLSSFNPALWGLDWPQGFTVDGEVHTSLDEARIAISDSQLRIPATDAFVDIDAELDRNTDQVMGTLQWSSLRWPLPEKQVQVRSDAGDVRLSGTMDSWSVIGDVAVGTERMPDGRFSLDASGTRDAAHARIIEGSVFGGVVAGEVDYEWRAEHQWAAVLDVAEIELTSLVPDWPGSLSGRVDGRGTARPFSLQATLENVTGLIRDAELVANGAIDITGKDVTAHNLRIEHGESSVSLDGSLTTSDGLHFSGVLADAGDYASDARGGLEATGHISVTDSALEFTLSATSPMLVYGETELENIELNIAGDDEQQTLDISANHLGTGLLLGMSGAFEDWRQPLESTWRGNVGEFGIDLDDEHTMALAAAAPVGLSKTDITLQDFCIGDSTGASLCADIEWHETGNYAGSLAVQDVPVKMVEHVVETGLNFEQRISGELNWRHELQAGSSGDGRLRLSAGTVSSAENASLSVRTGDGTIDFAVEDGALLSADLDLPMPGTGTVTGRFAVLDVRRFGDSRISGLLDADISDVALLSLLIPEIDSASGQLRAHAELEGTLEEPLVTGELELQGASFEYLPIGLSLQEVNLEGHLNDRYQANLTGSFRSGDGVGELVSSADYSDTTSPGLRFHLRGDNLTLIDVPDVFVVVNTDIDVSLEREALSIDGELLVPRARIKPNNLSASRVNESSDVVIVEGVLPHPPEEDVSTSNIEYSGSLDVTLGNSVVVNLDRARATVSGGVVFEWQGGIVPMANGRYDIAGSVAAFGQVLDIEEGAVRFRNVLADSPFIRIIAEREIYGNTQVKQAGVLIEGPIDRLRVDPFTVPMTTEERALTLLVTGSDFDYEQGVGAIDFGTYIAPRLFVSYGVGVFERENILSARFDLSKRFGIKASSGSQESGVDLNYRFEN